MPENKMGKRGGREAGLAGDGGVDEPGSAQDRLEAPQGQTAWE